MMKVTTSTSLEKEVVDRVSDLARKEKRSDAWIIREAVDRGLPILERELTEVVKNGKRKAA